MCEIWHGQHDKKCPMTHLICFDTYFPTFSNGGMCGKCRKKLKNIWNNFPNEFLTLDTSNILPISPTISPFSPHWQPVTISQFCPPTTCLTVSTYCQFVPEHIVWQIHLVTWSSPKMLNCKASDESWKARPSSCNPPNLSLSPPKLYWKGLLSL